MRAALQANVAHALALSLNELLSAEWRAGKSSMPSGSEFLVCNTCACPPTMAHIRGLNEKYTSTIAHRQLLIEHGQTKHRIVEIAAYLYAHL